MTEDRPSSEVSGADAGGVRTSHWDPSFVDAVGADRLFQTLVEEATECFLVVDGDDRVVFANPAVDDVFGYAPGDVVGDRLVRLLPERYRDRHLEGFARYLRTGERRIDWNYLEFPGLHRSGREVPLAVSFRELPAEDREYFVGIVRDVTDRIEHREQLEREQSFVESVFQALPDVLYAFDRDGRFLRWNDHLNEVTGYSDEEIAEMSPLEFIAPDDRDAVATAIADVLEAGESRTVETRLVRRDGTEIAYEFTGGPLVDDGEIVGQTGVGRDVSARKDREATLRRLNALNGVIRSVHDALIRATTREEIEAAVCEELVTEGGYRGAAFGEFDRESERLDVGASAGVDVSGLDDVLPARGGRSLAARAADERTVQTETDLDSAADARRSFADARGVRSVAAVPVVTEDRLFGVLGVYSDRADAFAERERTILAELGEAIGDAIEDSLTRKLLYGNTVTEIELRTTDPGLSFVRLATETGCRIELERALSFGDELVFYMRMRDASPEEIVAAAEADESIDGVVYLGSDGDDHLFEFASTSGTLTSILVEHNARTTAATVDDGVATLTVELPPGGDVRALVERLREAYPETTFYSRREVERSLATPMEIREELAAEMTEKQRAALEAAFYSGYFEWPTRQSTAEDVAELLNIAPQTFHQHLRIAQRKLLTAVFAGTDGREAE